MTDTPNIRKHSSEVVDGIECAPARAMLRAVGFSDEDFTKPQIGIASTWAMVTPCNMHINKLADEAEKGANAAGGKAVLGGRTRQDRIVLQLVAGRRPVVDALALALEQERHAARDPFLIVVRIDDLTSPGDDDAAALEHDDGATASAKHVRDTVAAWAGVDDGSARIRFVVTQEKGAAGVRITAAPWVARRVACPSCGCSVAVEGTEAGR